MPFIFSGDGMNAYMAYKVAIQVKTLSVFVHLLFSGTEYSYSSDMWQQFANRGNAGQCFVGETPTVLFL